jgi:peptidoglycan/LPS O-acetylase OafA/YrhL
VTRSFSLYLDILRSLAAFVVVISHIGYTRFTDGRWLWVRELNLGSDAVVLFFVLSGLVIALTAQTKDHTIGAFGFNRITRILSVAFPALVIGFVLDRTGAHLFPEFYALGWYQQLPLVEQLLRGLSFSNEWGGMATRLGSNGPYWSLSYEVAYYAIFAIGFYLHGALRIALIAIFTTLVGVKIMLLAPCWIMGVLLWKCIRRGYILPRSVARAFFIIPILFYCIALAVDVPGMLSHYTQLTLGLDGLRFSDEFIWNWILSCAFGFHLIGAMSLFKKEPTARQAIQIKWLAGGSFSLYLMHYPVLQFLGPALPQSGLPLLDDIALFSITVLFCFAFAQIFERTVSQQRRVLENTLMYLKGEKGFRSSNR